ncbi:MAG: Tfp pilus assembly protein FimT/FimU [Gammaproteobacteria bacterium]
MTRTVSTGFSLAELLTAIAVMALVASVAVPIVSDTRPDAPQAALQAITDALRYARERASLTGDVYGVDVADNELRVFRLSAMTSPGTPEYDVVNPLTRQPYRLRFGEGAYRDIDVGPWTLQSDSSCNASTRVGFDAQGLSRCIDPLSLRVKAQLAVSYRGTSFRVGIEPLTGRVRYQ